MMLNSKLYKVLEQQYSGMVLNSKLYKVLEQQYSGMVLNSKLYKVLEQQYSGMVRCGVNPRNNKTLPGPIKKRILCHSSNTLYLSSHDRSVLGSGVTKQS